MANVDTETETAKLTERQRSLLNLAEQFKMSAAKLLGTEDIRIDISLTVPRSEYAGWMEDTIKSDGVWVGITDDSLPF